METVSKNKHGRVFCGRKEIVTERLRFEGINQVFEFDIKEPHSMHDAAFYAIDDHRPIVSIESDDGCAISDILAKLGEHRFSCGDRLEDTRMVKGY